jgi:hypothetical protein
MKVMGSKNIPTLRMYKNLSERLELGKFVNFGQLHCFWIRIRIRIPNVDPDPGEPNQSGSMRIRINNTAKTFKQITAIHGDTY